MSKISTDKISVQMYTLRDHTQTKDDLSSTLKRLADMGFKNVQYSLQNFLTADEAKELLSNYGLKNDSPYCADLYNFDADKDNLMHQLTVFDTPYLRISSVPRSENNTDGILRFASEVNRIGKELAYDGINLLYHFHSFEFYKENSKTMIELLLENTNPEYMQIMPDIFWIADGGVAPTDFLSAYADRFDFIHIKDYAISKINPETNRCTNEFAAVGDGNLNIPSILNITEENDTKMYIIEQDETYGRDAFDEVKRSFDYLMSYESKGGKI